MPHILEQDIAFLQRLNSHPVLRARVESLLGVVEDADGDLEKADAAEYRVIEELRQMGNEVLAAWAQSGVARCVESTETEPRDRSGGKKNSIGIRRTAISR